MTPKRCTVRQESSLFFPSTLLIFFLVLCSSFGSALFLIGTTKCVIQWKGNKTPQKEEIQVGGGCRDIVTAEMQSLERWCERFLKRALAALQRSPSGFRRTAAFANASCHRSTTSQWCILPRRTPAFLRIYPGRESSLTLG